MRDTASQLLLAGIAAFVLGLNHSHTGESLTTFNGLVCQLVSFLVSGYNASLN